MGQVHEQHRARRVMIVDDEDASRDALGVQLRAEGYEVFAAHRGQEAVALAAKTHPDATVLELGDDGMATLQALRRRGEGGTVVVLTAHGTIPSARSALMLGADGYMTRPFNLALLKSALTQGRSDHARH